MSNRTLNIAFALNDDYAQYTCVAIKSIIANHRGDYNIIVHLLTDWLSDKSQKLIADTFASANTPITYKIHIVDDSILDNIVVSHYTKYTWYRMLLPTLLPDTDKVLYLDVDLVVNDDLGELLDIDMQQYAIANAHDTDTFLDETFTRCGYPKHKGYVCAGVTLINLNRWRELDIPAKAIAWARQNTHRIKYPDQDALNVVCQDLKMYLPLKYNVTKSTLSQPWFYSAQFADELIEAITHPAIVHYAGCAPWLRESDHPMLDVWIKYNNMISSPAKRKYKTKGLLGLKLKIFDILHPGYSRAPITVDEALKKANDAKQKQKQP